MVKPLANIHGRATEFKDDGFYVSEANILMCRYCNVRIEWKKRDTCQKHCKSVGHKTKKDSADAGTSTAKRQATIEDALQVQKKAKLEKIDFICDTTEMIMKVNIPAEKLDHPAFRAWMNKYVPGSGDIPSASQIRKEYMPKISARNEKAIKDLITGKKLAIMCDETTDKKGRAVFTILARTMEGTLHQECVVLSVCFLEKVNSTTCSQAIVDALKRYEIDYKDVLAFVSDGARYMGKCFDLLTVLIGNHIIRISCWSHRLNLIGDIWQNVLKDLNTLVCKVKNAFVNARKLKNAYLTYMQNKHPDIVPKLFPEPVLTRWNSWFCSVLYLNEYFSVLASFICKYDELNSQAVHLKTFLKDKTDIFKVYLSFVAENCHTLVDLITFSESESSPCAHLLVGRLEQLRTRLNLVRNERFGENTTNLLLRLTDVKQTQLKSEFKRCAEKSLLKLHDYRKESKSNSVYEGLAKLFDPSAIGCIKNPDMPQLSKILCTLPEFSKNSTQYEGAYADFYKKVFDVVKSDASASCDVTHILNALKSTSSENMEFGVKALRALWLPISNANCERFFSRYNLVVSDMRTSMKEQNVETCNMLYFNQ